MYFQNVTIKLFFITPYRSMVQKHFETSVHQDARDKLTYIKFVTHITTLYR